MEADEGSSARSWPIAELAAAGGRAVPRWKRESTSVLLESGVPARREGVVCTEEPFSESTVEVS